MPSRDDHGLSPEKTLASTTLCALIKQQLLLDSEKRYHIINSCASTSASHCDLIFELVDQSENEELGADSTEQSEQHRGDVHESNAAKYSKSDLHATRGRIGNRRERENDI